VSGWNGRGRSINLYIVTILIVIDIIGVVEVARTITVSLPSEVVKKLTEITTRTGITRSRIITAILKHYLGMDLNETEAYILLRIGEEVGKDTD